MTNPFDEEPGSFLVIINAEQQQSLWPDFIPIPEGWHSIHGPADRHSSTRFIDARWSDLGPVRLAAKVG
jgi:MbtH protein